MDEKDIPLFQDGYSEPEIFDQIISSYFEKYGPVHFQISAYNDFLNFGIQKVVSQETTISVTKDNIRCEIDFENDVIVHTPSYINDERKLKTLYPNYCRERNLTYDALVTCSIKETITNLLTEKETVTIHTNVPLFRIPMMLRCERCNLHKLHTDDRIKKGECENDPGGYFIIKGKERVLVAQVRANYNKPFIVKKNDEHVAEVRSMSDETAHSVAIRIFNVKDNIVVSLPHIKEPIPLGIVFKSLGFFEDMWESMIGNFPDILKNIKYTSKEILTEEDAIIYIGNRTIQPIAADERKNFASQIMTREIFPHMGIVSSKKERAIFIADIATKFIKTTLNLRCDDDRDNYSNRRIEVSGILMCELFRTHFKKVISETKMQIEKKGQKVLSIVKILELSSKSITKGIQTAFTSGNWGVSKNTYIRTGVSQILDRLTYISSISHLRRVVIPIGREGKVSLIRQIHPSSFGYICPCESPEGQTIGTTLNMSVFAKVSARVDPIVLKQVLCKKLSSLMILVQDIEFEQIKTKVFLNGTILGSCDEPTKVVDKVRDLRLKNIIDKEVSIAYDNIDNEIRMYSDEGRFTRPVFRVENNKIPIMTEKELTWKNLVKENIIVYVDTNEIEYSLIAMYPNELLNSDETYDYCEIHPSGILGVVASLIPFSDHSQGPRNSFNCSQRKQAIGVPTLNKRADTILYKLHYPQTSLSKTKYSDYLKSEAMPAGCNAIVAIATYTGFNQEDSIIMNQSAIERGMFNVTQYKTIEESEKKCDNYSTERIGNVPENTVGIKATDPKYFRRRPGNYSKLDERGVIKKGQYVKKGDVIVGKIIIKTEKNSDVETKIDVSRVVHDDEEGFVDSVNYLTNPNGYCIIKIVIRTNKTPMIGDKFSSGEGQKGTVGMVYRQEDMPFTASGIVPDIIINPHAMPSRMTINQLIECVTGKIAAVKGKCVDVTPFTENSINAADKFCDELKNLGYQSQGWEPLYSGFTGKMISSKIFIGPTYYYRLKHMVANKMHARSRGAVTTLLRQPLEGRARDGGLRVGEMERDCLISHGASSFLQERLFKVSDPFEVPVCMNKNCGVISANMKQCHMCNHDDIKIASIPYAAKLLFQELNAMGIKTILEAK